MSVRVGKRQRWTNEGRGHGQRKANRNRSARGNFGGTLLRAFWTLPRKEAQREEQSVCHAVGNDDVPGLGRERDSASKGDAVNRVELSGTILTEIDMRRRPDNSETGSVFFKFSDLNGTVLLFAWGEERVRKLARFRPGDAVRIFGRLTVNQLNGKAGIIVDQARHLNELDESAKDRDVAEWEAGRQFRQHARVVGNRG